MKIVVYAGFAATDGSLPESINVEIQDDERFPMTTTDMIDVAAGVMKHIGAMTERRMVTAMSRMDDGLGLALRAASPAPVVDPCARTLCGHDKAHHRSTDERDREVGDGNGMCRICLNGDKCRSFVSSAPLVRMDRTDGQSLRAVKP